MTKNAAPTWTIYSDGAAKGNPGPAAAGWLILDDQGRTVSRQGRYLGTGTNNEAEYQALIGALEDGWTRGAPAVRVYSDSELMVRQLNGEYRVRNQRLNGLFRRAQELLKRFQEYGIIHIPREQNREADRLANEAIREHYKKNVLSE